MAFCKDSRAFTRESDTVQFMHESDYRIIATSIASGIRKSLSVNSLNYQRLCYGELVEVPNGGAIKNPPAPLVPKPVVSRLLVSVMVEVRVWRRLPWLRVTRPLVNGSRFAPAPGAP